MSSTSSSATAAAAAAAAMSSSKKRYVWPESLHRDFIAAVFDVGLRVASTQELRQTLPPSLRESMSERAVDLHLHKWKLFRNRSVVPRSTFFDEEATANPALKRSSSQTQLPNPDMHSHTQQINNSNSNNSHDRKLKDDHTVVFPSSSTSSAAAVAETTGPRLTDSATTTNGRPRVIDTLSPSSIDETIDTTSTDNPVLPNSIALAETLKVVQLQLQHLARSIEYNQQLLLHLQQTIPRQQTQYLQIVERIRSFDVSLASQALGLFHSSTVETTPMLNQSYPLPSPALTSVYDGLNGHMTIQPLYSTTADSTAIHSNGLPYSNQTVQKRVDIENEVDESSLSSKRVRLSSSTSPKVSGNSHSIHVGDNLDTASLLNTHAPTSSAGSSLSAQGSTSRTELSIMNEMRAQMDLHRRLLLQKENQLTQLGGLSQPSSTSSAVSSSTDVVAHMPKISIASGVDDTPTFPFRSAAPEIYNGLSSIGVPMDSTHQSMYNQDPQPSSHSHHHHHHTSHPGHERHHHHLSRQQQSQQQHQLQHVHTASTTSTTSSYAHNPSSIPVLESQNQLFSVQTSAFSNTSPPIAPSIATGGSTDVWDLDLAEDLFAFLHEAQQQ